MTGGKGPAFVKKPTCLAEKAGSPAKGGGMELSAFRARIEANIAVGGVLPNPGGGTSTITRIEDKGVRYRRGKSIMLLRWEIFYRAYRHFCGRFVDTGDLKAFDNSFDSAARDPAGHSCNCTFAFMLLERAVLADGIVKQGRRFGTHFLQAPVR